MRKAAKRIAEDINRQQTTANIAEPQIQTTQEEPLGMLGKFGKKTGEYAVGIAKSFGKVAKGGLKLVGRGLEAVAPAPKGGMPEVTEDIERILPEKIFEAKTGAEKAGFITGEGLQYLIPAGRIAKVEKTIDTMIQGTKFLSRVGRVGTKAGTEAIATGTIRAAQTEDIKQGATAGITAGGIRGVLGAGGEMARKLRFPERLYSQIFKNSFDDMRQALKAMGTENFRRANPERFNQLVKDGVIKFSKSGEMIIDESLAKQALDKGLKGSLMNMVDKTVEQGYELENAAQKIVKNHTKPVQLPGQYKAILNEISEEYKNVGFGQIATKARALANKMQNNTVNAETALEMRRFLDSMRFARAFDVPATKLSQSQQNFKFLADALRKKLAKEVPDLQPVMKDYGFYIEALDALANEAKRRGNNQVLGFIDATLFGGTLAGANLPAAATALGLKKYLTSPKTTTKIGSKIYGAGATTKGITLRELFGYGVSEFIDQDRAP